MLYRINIVGSKGDKVKIAIPFKAVKLLATNEKAMEAFKKNRIMKLLKNFLILVISSGIPASSFGR